MGVEMGLGEYWDAFLDYLRAAEPAYIYLLLFVGSFMETGSTP